jgi:hypothetical protein
MARIEEGKPVVENESRHNDESQREENDPLPDANIGRPIERQADSHAPDENEPASEEPEKPSGKERISVCNWLKSQWKKATFGGILMVFFTAMVAIATTAYVLVSCRQLGVMSGQLKQMQIDSRAWVGLKDSFRQTLVSGKKIEVELQFINTGQTPAQKVEISGAIILRQAGFDMESYGTAHIKRGSLGPSQGSLAPNAVIHTVVSSPFDATDSVIAEIRAGRYCAYVFGEATYRDMLGEHETRYCYIVDPNEIALRVYNQYNYMD